MSVIEKFAKIRITENTDKMINRIMAREDAFYRLEQRGTPDLTTDEKRELLETLFLKDPWLFMMRYHKYLTVEDCDCFDQNDYEVQHYTKKIMERCKDTDTRNREDVRMRNQRYAELERLKKETDYFSDSKMREREPLLFDKMIGRFLAEEEQFHLRPTIENESLSGIFMQLEDSQIISNRRTAHLNEWNDFFMKSNHNEGSASKLGNLAQHASSRFCEEIESDDEDQDATKCEKTHEKSVSGDCKSTKSCVVKEEEMLSESSEEEDDKEQLRADFIDHMEQRFLRGDDLEFYDYSLIDNVMTKEYARMREQDLEDAYFEND